MNQITLFIPFFFLLLRISFCYVDPMFLACQPMTCGNNQNISYPFYITDKQKDFCGNPGFELTCNKSFPILNLMGTNYIVQKIFYNNHTLRLSNAVFSESTTSDQCIGQIQKLSVGKYRFHVAPNQSDVLLFYGCDLTSLPEDLKSNKIGCSQENKTSSVVASYKEDESLRKACKGDVVNVTVEDVKGGIKEALRKGFVLNWDATNCNACTRSGGRCGFDLRPDIYAFRCYCRDRVYADACYTATADGSGKKNKIAEIVGITVSAIVVIFGLLGIYLIRRKRKLQSVLNGNTEQIFSSNMDDLELPMFDFDTLTMATNNFSEANKIGVGGFGSVYKGMLIAGHEIAVKRLSKTSEQGVEEFKNEAKLIIKLQHRNLVRMLGCCIEKNEKLLVYEYMENRSLDSFLFSNDKRHLLDWKRRFDIICGIAKGILYLHCDSRFRIIHRDLKASNILLDKEMNPKISDFGMARMFRTDQTEANTVKVVGTYGYMAPEYAMDGNFSVKSDVFSFGVLVLEIISGKKNRGFYYTNYDMNLLGYVWKQWGEGTTLELIDPSIGDSYSICEGLRCIHIGLLCVQEHAEDRPTMSSVVMMLNSESTSMPQPKSPGFSVGKNHGETSKKDETCSVNQVTVTLLDAR